MRGSTGDIVVVHMTGRRQGGAATAREDNWKRATGVGDEPRRDLLGDGSRSRSTSAVQDLLR